MKYRKKPAVVEAVQFDRSKAEKNVAKYYPMITDMAKLTTAEGTKEREDRFFISSSEGNMTVRDGDYIIKGTDDEYYLRKPYIFEKIYEVASQQPQLNDNQKIVLEWLKKQYHERISWPFPFSILKNAINDMPENVFAFYDDLNEKEEFEIVMAFAQWGLEQEESSNEI
ncbi:hypothetical protein ACFC3E_02965 [Enterococcus thailandicus]|uniref:hypothetical protein n=1 Tax=Enterococcus thailandicus TaxID=417368 RepID=UPI0039A49180